YCLFTLLISNDIFHRRSLLRYGLFSNACRNILLGCTLLAFIPIDVDTLVSTINNFERKPKKKPSNDNANAYKQSQFALASLIALIRSQDYEGWL
ncbi:unnamed protein product, partial [Pocillopora meandrina]